ncbi:MAG: hypothetical protein ACRDRU_04985 [Pseudonocardiaceae bacterium]
MRRLASTVETAAIGSDQGAVVITLHGRRDLSADRRRHSRRTDRPGMPPQRD